MTTKRLWASAFALVAASIAVPLAGPADAAAVSVDLCATTGTVGLPAGASAPVWGFVLGDCSTTGNADLQNNVITGVNAGDDLTINLTVDGAIGENVSLIVPTIAGAPDLTGVAGGTTSYTFNNVSAGTHLFESGVNPGVQIPMGLFGALVVAGGTPADVEQVLVLSEIDVDLNANPNGFNRNDYAPEYFLINGQTAPDVPSIAANAGDSVLLRYVNAGSRAQSMAILGARKTIIAREGRTMPLQRSVVAEMISPGHTVDAMVDVPASTPDGSSFVLYNRNGRLVDNGQGESQGGMQTSITVGPLVSSGPALYASFQNTGSIGGVAYGDEDILRYENGTWSMFLDFQDTSGPGRHLPGNADVNAMHVLGPDHVIVSFAGSTRVFQPDGSRVLYRDVDIVEFNAGTWSMYQAGTELELVFNDHDIDGLQLLDNGNLLISTRNNVAGVLTQNGADGWPDEDVMEVTPPAGAAPALYSTYIDSSDVFGTLGGGEDINGFAEEDDGNMVLTTFGNFSVPRVGPGPLRGDNDDVLRLLLTGTGVPTSGEFAADIVVDAEAIITAGPRAGRVDRLDALAIG